MSTQAVANRVVAMVKQRDVDHRAAISVTDKHYVIWATINGKLVEHKLLIEVTDERRLASHYLGFVQNIGSGQ